MSRQEYTEAEKQEFRNKDLRICKQAIIKSLIKNLPESEVMNEVEKVCKVADKYVDYVYKESEDVKTEKKQDTWEYLAKSCNIVVPESESEKVLDAIYAEVQTRYERHEMLQQIYAKYNKYPTSKNSIKTVVEFLKSKC